MAASHIIWAGGNAANLVGLSLPVEGAQLRSNGNRTPELFDRGANAQLFQCGGMATGTHGLLQGQAGRTTGRPVHGPQRSGCESHWLREREPYALFGPLKQV